MQDPTRLDRVDMTIAVARGVFSQGNKRASNDHKDKVKPNITHTIRTCTCGVQKKLTGENRSGVTMTGMRLIRVDYVPYGEMPRGCNARQKPGPSFYKDQASAKLAILGAFRTTYDIKEEDLLISNVKTRQIPVPGPGNSQQKPRYWVLSMDLLLPIHKSNEVLTTYKYKVRGDLPGTLGGMVQLAFLPPLQLHTVLGRPMIECLALVEAAANPQAWLQAHCRIVVLRSPVDSPDPMPHLCAFLRAHALANLHKPESLLTGGPREVVQAIGKQAAMSQVIDMDHIGHKHLNTNSYPVTFANHESKVLFMQKEWIMCQSREFCIIMAPCSVMDDLNKGVISWVQRGSQPPTETLKTHLHPEDLLGPGRLRHQLLATDRGPVVPHEEEVSPWPPSLQHLDH